ncbi:MAG: hypothetical protein ACXQTR_03395 [Candidatus Methanospirareceae archaeon]
MADILFLLALGGIFSFINYRVQKDSDGKYSNFFEALMDGLNKATESLKKAPPLEQAVFGFLLGILKAAAGFMDKTVEELIGDVDNISDFFSNVGESLGQATFDALDKVKGSIDDLSDRIKTFVEDNLDPILRNLKDIDTKIKEELDESLKKLSSGMDGLKQELSTSIQEQIEQSRRVTTELESLIKDESYATLTDLEELWNDMVNKAKENLYNATTVADTYLNQEVFTTTLQMKMWADLIEASTTVDEEQLRENLRKQMSVYKDLYLEAIKQYRDIAEILKTSKRTGA